MAHEIVIIFDSDSSEFVEIQDDRSPNHSGSGSSNSDWASSISGPPVISNSESVELASSSSTAYCLCEDEDFLVECLTCGSFFELGIFCPGC
jgi:hypothetical protein